MKLAKITSTERDYHFDILRFIAMSMIITHHIIIYDFGLQPILYDGTMTIPDSQLFPMIIINSFAIVGVNLFFLISGYFKIKLSKKKLILFIAEVYLVYGIVTIIGMISNNVPVNINTFYSILFPFDEYWFLPAYLGLMVVSPFLNKLIDYIDPKKAKLILFTVFLLFSLYAFKHDTGFIMNGGYSLIWAISMYIIGGLIKKFNIKKSKGICLYWLSALLLSLAVYSFYLLENFSTAWFLYDYNNIIVLIESIAFFLYANSWKFTIKNNQIIKFIGFLGKNTLMVYLLHSAYWLTVYREIPVHLLLENGHFGLAILLLPIYVLFIYILCAGISVIYQLSIGQLLNRAIAKLERHSKTNPTH